MGWKYLDTLTSTVYLERTFSELGHIYGAQVLYKAPEVIRNSFIKKIAYHI